MIRDAAARVLAGESLTSLCRSLNEAGTKTVMGSAWTPVTLRGLLLAPRIAGLREYRGQVIGAGAWEPIISPEDAERLRILLTD
ncbi:MAG: recombinase family protein, partial [Micrococcales bacterium]|nr:recombinase family protein [Micrococcales bacterium]